MPEQAISFSTIPYYKSKKPTKLVKKIRSQWIYLIDTPHLRVYTAFEMLLPFVISAQWIWVALVIIFAVIEILTFGLTTVWFAIAALIMVFLSFLAIPLPVQVLIFLAISAVLLIFTRPVAVRKLKVGKEKTNVESFAGKHVLVTRAIGEFENGEVKLNGLIWTARSENNTVIPEGTKCEVLRVEGVQLIVRPLTITEENND
jgi:membrane protein implicated in regulation of membrane protease activity